LYLHAGSSVAAQTRGVGHEVQVWRTWFSTEKPVDQEGHRVFPQPSILGFRKETAQLPISTPPKMTVPVIISVFLLSFGESWGGAAESLVLSE
jgi:hypothetical protein